MHGSDQELPDGGNQDSVRRIAGEPVNPWRKVCGFYPPDVVTRQRNLTEGQKRLYERAVRWAGNPSRL